MAEAEYDVDGPGTAAVLADGLPGVTWSMVAGPSGPAARFRGGAHALRVVAARYAVHGTGGGDLDGEVTV